MLCDVRALYSWYLINEILKFFVLKKNLQFFFFWVDLLYFNLDDEDSDMHLSLLFLNMVKYKKGKTSLITPDLLSFLKIGTQILKSVNLGYPYFFLFFFIYF
jgi:hypothetical protein